LPYPRPGSLTDREVEVLELVATGLSTSRVARSLLVSEQAVTYHLGNLMGKFHADNRTGLVSRAFVTGVLLPETWPPRVALVWRFSTPDARARVKVRPIRT